MNTFELYAKLDAEDAARIEQLQQHAVAVRDEHADALAAARAEYREALDTVLDAYARATPNRGFGGYRFDVNIDELNTNARAASERVDEIELPILRAEWAVRSAIVKARRDAAQRAADLDTEDYSNATFERRAASMEAYYDNYRNRYMDDMMERGERADMRMRNNNRAYEGRANQ